MLISAIVILFMLCFKMLYVYIDIAFILNTCRYIYIILLYFLKVSVVIIVLILLRLVLDWEVLLVGNHQNA